MRYFFISLALFAILSIQAVDFPPSLAQQTQTGNVAGRWRVKFTLSGVGENNLIFESRAGGSGSFILGNDDKSAPLPATWSLTTNDRINFSGEVELQLSACCRDTGTLIFKGKLKPDNSISGKAIFIATTENEENFNGYTSTVGTFTATRVTDDK